jgi:uncharacterized protein
MSAGTVVERIAKVDWMRVRASLEERGYATIGPILAGRLCRELATFYPQRERFRSRVDMARLRFGVGEYKYFAAPLPPLVATLRTELYRRVAPIANEWAQVLRLERCFPPSLEEFLADCHRAGQFKPTPLMLRYTAGGYNCLHQDLYGEVVFPLQFTLMLSDPARDFEGGEFLLVEQPPRAQSRGHAVALRQGEAILFGTRYRPMRGTRGWYRVKVRHGVSQLARGHRTTLGIIFHDAK